MFCLWLNEFIIDRFTGSSAYYLAARSYLICASLEKDRKICKICQSKDVHEIVVTSINFRYSNCYEEYNK